MKLSTLFNHPTRSQDEDDVTTRVARMVHDAQAQGWAHDVGLRFMNVTWEDCARSKNSCWGPCISDMTLIVENTRMPVLRVPNFADPIMSIPTRKIFVTVGNESPYIRTPRSTISLQEYLENITKYTELEHSLFAPDHDDHAVVSTQASFLPIETETTEFHVGLYNYQSSVDDPAVLVLVCTAAGTSAQVMTESDAILYSNEQGVTSNGAMTAREEACNYVMIVQIPLQQKPPPPMRQYSNVASWSCEEEEECAVGGFATTLERPDVEEAMVSLGEALGPFPKLSQFRNVTRDARYPIRVTIQFYQATSNGVVTREIVERLSDRMEQVKANATWWGSLVCKGDAFFGGCSDY
ncbi:hypothetical protein SPRG_19715 [Saprolegnia parasitica CBS 223.65]|uniref:Uncharacterized protein n=1 Tax=Saprolegnia parasitica (strain CBS 223.65) TaxID=695850 RepID=A0A067CGF2_SAPPC|nr:hypothetical protein SPRG_19715 [Saprolegnia parasitica CBS 223.65]KDO29829.1 hypothetical protein SPRG_19715 [Saprolegnia parasitica CBS 223.65]|eukprot:XP_012199534.1 hypothetical protein SPRG_19715 [Saprolegnia parasitica CBS 223.65]